MPEAPGWHTDPSDDTKWRFWDGTDWAEQTRPKSSGGVATGPPPPIAPTPAPPQASKAQPTRSAGIGRFLGRKTDAEKTSLAEYQSLLDAMVAGSVDLRQLPEQLRGTAEAAGLRDRKASKLQDQAFRALAQRMLRDDILTVAEEHELLDVADALGIEQSDFEGRFLDVAQHLMIARVNDGRLPVLDQHLLIGKSGEVVHMETSAALLKEVVHREYRGGGGGVSVPLGLGARFSTGGFRGKSVVVGTSLEAADSGTLSVTDRRVVFQGQKKTLECRYDKMVGMEAFSDGLRIGVSNRQTASLFRIPAGPVVAAMINGAMQKL